MTEPAAISGLDDTSQTRVVLYHSGRLVHVPWSAIGGQPLDATLTALAAFNTNGLLTQTAADTFTGRTITGTANKIDVANGSGVAGNPTLTIPDAVTLVTPTVTGLLTASGGQIAFPATQVPSADANTLDDYEEGTWTPTLTTTGVNFSSVTYDAVTAGKYTKIGRVVFVEGKLRTDAVTVGSATGTVLIGGFPFTAGAAPNGCVAIGGSTQSWNAQNPLHLTMIAATTTAQLYHRTAVTGGTVANTVAGVNTGADQNETAFGGYYFV